MNQQNKLANELEACGSSVHYGLPGDTKFITDFAMTDKDRDLIVAALRAAGSAEPVAWRRRRKGTIGNDGWIMCPLKPERDSEFELQALGVIGTASHPAPAEHERKMVAEISFDPTNHHNALKCPYCNPKGLKFAETAPAESVREALAKLREIEADDSRGRYGRLAREAIATLSPTPLPQAAEKAAETVEFVSLRREWLENVILGLQGNLPSGRIGDNVFLLREQFRDILDRDAPTEPSPSSPIMQTASAAETVAEPKNLPDSWDYMKDTNSVRCGGCLFRFGAEHPDSDGKWTCPNCGDGNGEKEAAAEPTQEEIAAIIERHIPYDEALNMAAAILALKPRGEPAREGGK